MFAPTPPSAPPVSPGTLSTATSPAVKTSAPFLIARSATPRVLASLAPTFTLLMEPSVRLPARLLSPIVLSATAPPPVASALLATKSQQMERNALPCVLSATAPSVSPKLLVSHA